MKWEEIEIQSSLMEGVLFLLNRKVKNSWSAQWGDNGYIYIARDGSATSCGILNDASYPILGNDLTTTSPVGLTKGTATSHDCGGSTAVFTKSKLML